MGGRTSTGSKGGRRGRLLRKWVPAAAALTVVCGVSVPASAPLGQAAPTAQASGHDFVTRPDLHPPEVEVTTPAKEVGQGDILSAPVAPATMGVGQSPRAAGEAGALITDNSGEPVWFKPGTGIMDLKVQQYEGEPVLTWYQGKVIVPPGFGQGEQVIVNQNYEQIGTARTGNGVQADIHDFQITPQNTGLLLAYRKVPRDLTPVGGPADGSVYEGIVQEVDLKTGEVLLDWRSLDHVGLDESYLPVTQNPEEPWDYIHVNSVDLDGEGNLLVSARSTHTVYQINRQTGEVNWRLGGKNSDFRMGEGAAFQWQHDARRLPDGKISLFDNGEPAKLRSRGLVLDVDENARTADVAREDWRPAEIVSPNMGNYQLLDNGNGFVGWGGAPGMTELGPDGTVRYAAHFADGMASYRTFRAPWVGFPKDKPAVAANNDQGTTSVYVSWNGATEVTKWRVLAGADPQHLQPVADAPRDGFETRIDAADSHAYVKVEALDANDQVLGASDPVEVQQ